MYYLIFLFFPFMLAAQQQPTQNNISISFDAAQKLGNRIWQNECRGTEEGLTSWNENEDFASLGIGHFIWYPPGGRRHYNETFPQLLTFLESCGVTVPAKIKNADGCLWRSKSDFDRHLQSRDMRELRVFLSNTKSLQAVFMAQRLEQVLPKLLQNQDPITENLLRSRFLLLAQTPQGIYALIDYLNFKGEGLVKMEQYNGIGWGLMQVLLAMPKKPSQDPVQDFVVAAKAVLVKRVQNAPRQKDEKRWLLGWDRRLDTYLQP